MADRDDEMARTATAPPSTSQPVKPAQPIGATLGRYRLERELGEGGMGVVHAAFDPDLERRVAVKVLRTGDSSDARQRLLREARAMAKLAHPNVVVVHEVGSANGRDYVAMELVDGHSLAEWIRSERRDRDEILAAFVAAGRGLAAAHAAGLVHRDFKPHNVLRSRDGRILVTDFGLARGVEVSAIALDTTMRADQSTSPLSGLTETGSVLGTPAYMAPEAWQGKPVGPAADQFGFCVALWEALTGERPFKGDTIEELRKLVDQGAATLDLSKLPRRLRAPLTRGLDADPARRYPTMDALLANLAPNRRSRLPAVAGGIAIVAALGVFVATRQGDHALACPPPAIAWPDRPAEALVGAGHGELAKAIDRDIATWRTVRDSACAMTTTDRAPQLHCLDGVLARADAIAKAAATISGPLDSDVLVEALVDPVVCTRATPPRLHMAGAADMTTAFGLLAQASLDTPKLAARDAIAVADKPGIDPCARTTALAAAVALLEDNKAQQRIVETQLVTASAQCDDDRVLADALINDAEFHFEVPRIGAPGHDAVHKAQAAVARIDQADLVAEIDLLK
ncbi:MAG TPA: serine/threonine-protein kinase, partial [Kofleriaceae bacterium]|nr:serine/threonine-protein kinase [Kofleriaceae bacterium]